MNVVLPPRNGLSLCAGAGGLDLGLMLAQPDFHTRCWVEWEPHPRDAIMGGQRAGYFAPAPIWDDVTTFDGRPFRGSIDTILAGYPCQPFSHAGQRKGENDERHLWPDIARIIGEIEPRWVFLENVAGHVSLGAETVLRALWDMGWTPAAGVFTASEVGAPHKRERWFCVAYRECSGQQERQSRQDGLSEPHRVGERLADTNGRNTSAEREQCSGKLGFQSRREGALENAELTGAGDNAPTDKRGRNDLGGRSEGIRSRDGATGANGTASDGGSLENAGRAELRPRNAEGNQSDGREAGRDESTGRIAEPSETLVNAEGIGQRQRQPEPILRIGRDTAAASADGAMADAERSTGHEGRTGDAGGGIGTTRKAPVGAVGHGAYLFPPGPSDKHAWTATLDRSPDMAPALSLREVHAWARRCEALGIDWQVAAQSGLRDCVDGLAQRTRALKLLGNGVVPLEAGYAWRTLSAAHGLVPMDLEAAGGNVRTIPDGAIVRAAE